MLRMLFEVVAYVLELARARTESGVPAQLLRRCRLTVPKRYADLHIRLVRCGDGRLAERSVMPEGVIIILLSLANCSQSS